jgi:hypothetical protein
MSVLNVEIINIGTYPMIVSVKMGNFYIEKNF